MKLNNLFLLVLAIVVLYFFIERRKQAALVLPAPTPIAKLPLGAFPMLPVSITVNNTQAQAQKQGVTQIYTQTLKVGSSPRQLPRGKLVQNEIQLTAPSGNSGDVYLGDSPVAVDSGPRFSIAAGQQKTIKLGELSLLWFGGTLNDSISLMAEIKGG